MEASMSVNEVISRIKMMKENGDPLSKKKVKEKDPVLMKNALFYFPSWEHAIQNIS